MQWSSRHTFWRCVERGDAYSRRITLSTSTLPQCVRVEIRTVIFTLNVIWPISKHAIFVYQSSNAFDDTVYFVSDTHGACQHAHRRDDDALITELSGYD